MKTGIQISSFRPILHTPEQVREAFRNLREMGCRWVQLQWIDPAVDPDFVAKTMEEHQIQSVSIQELYGEFTKDPDYFLRYNAVTGGKWICVSRIPQSCKSPDAVHIYANELRALDAQARASGMEVCFHPVAADFEGPGDWDPVEGLLEAYPELPICADLYHLNKSRRNICQWLRNHSRNIVMVHFKDGKTAPDGSETLVPVGQGDIDWTGVVDCCLEIGVPYAFVEQERWEGDPFRALEAGLRWLEEQIPPAL